MTGKVFLILLVPQVHFPNKSWGGGGRKQTYFMPLLLLELDLVSPFLFSCLLVLLVNFPNHCQLEINSGGSIFIYLLLLKYLIQSQRLRLCTNTKWSPKCRMGGKSMVLSKPTVLHQWWHWSEDSSDFRYKKHQLEVMCYPKKKHKKGSHGHRTETRACKFILSPQHNLLKTLPNALLRFGLFNQGTSFSLVFNNMTKKKYLFVCLMLRFFC